MMNNKSSKKTTKLVIDNRTVFEKRLAFLIDHSDLAIIDVVSILEAKKLQLVLEAWHKPGNNK